MISYDVMFCNVIFLDVCMSVSCIILYFHIFMFNVVHGPHLAAPHFECLSNAT